MDKSEFRRMASQLGYVKVIRCRDCKWSALHTQDRCRCQLLDFLGGNAYWVNIDGFCDRAEPREDEN